MHTFSEYLRSFEELWILAGGSPINWIRVGGVCLIIVSGMILLYDWLKSKVEKVGYVVGPGGKCYTFYRYKS